LHNGIDRDHWPSTSRAPRTGDPILLFLGRLEWEKGIQDAIAGLARVRRTHPGTRLVVAGEGSQLGWLRDEARRHRVVRAVTFLGHLQTSELLSWLSRADAVVLPSRYEPFGIVALEAAAAGAPLVASAAGGLGEAVLDGDTGLSFAPGDVAGLTTAVRTVLDDPEAAAQRARRARARLDTDFNWTAIAAATVDVYASAKRRQRGPLARPTIAERPLPNR